MRWTDLTGRNSHESLTASTPGFGESCANKARAGFRGPSPRDGGLPVNCTEGVAVLGPGRSSPGLGRWNRGDHAPARGLAEAASEAAARSRPRSRGPSGSASSGSPEIFPCLGAAAGPSFPHPPGGGAPAAPQPRPPPRPGAPQPGPRQPTPRAPSHSPSSPRRSQ